MYWKKKTQHSIPIHNKTNFPAWSSFSINGVSNLVSPKNHSLQFVTVAATESGTLHVSSHLQRRLRGIGAGDRVLPRNPAARQNRTRCSEPSIRETPQDFNRRSKGNHHMAQRRALGDRQMRFLPTGHVLGFILRFTWCYFLCFVINGAKKCERGDWFKKRSAWKSLKERRNDKRFAAAALCTI